MTSLPPPRKAELAPRVNANIKAELARRDIPDAQVLAGLNISADTLRRRRRGDAEWPLGQIEAIAILLGIDEMDLFRE